MRPAYRGCDWSLWFEFNVEFEGQAISYGWKAAKARQYSEGVPQS